MGRHVFALLAAMACGAAFAAEPLTSRESHIETAGSIVRTVIPVAALLGTWVLQPEGKAGSNPAGSFWLMGGSPRHDLLLGLGRAWVATGILKSTVSETRPDGGKHSFPSGHASIAFAGAEFIRKEYGWGWGTPALLAAGFTGWSRVEAKRHYTRDVLAGAAIGVLADHDFWRWRAEGITMAAMPAMIDTGPRTAPGVLFELNFP
ncbi:MAG TPA: phosphatase PAP2 family protein [Steroidobacteraceae bacterium]|nr:phosphatase PAP2 family protein [Steroidobacteraceae bacterium]